MQIFSDAQLEKVRVMHKRVVAKTTTAVAEAMAEAGEEAVAYAKLYPRFTPRTGHLQRSTDWRTVKIAGGRVLRIRNTAKYAAAIDKGARPHDIHPKIGNEYLRFKGKFGWVRTRRVKHPGNKPYRFLHGASLVAGRLIEKKIRAKFAIIARTF